MSKKNSDLQTFKLVSASYLLRNEYIKKFAQESNEIEGIHSDVADKVHEEALFNFLNRKLSVSSITKFVSKIQQNAILRKLDSCVVYIGGHQAPPSKKSLSTLKEIIRELNRLDSCAALTQENSFLTHNTFEMIHPFTDGNGRAGRALWLWCMVKARWEFGLSFKHKYYYQTLSYWWDSVYRENK